MANLTMANEAFHDVNYPWKRKFGNLRLNRFLKLWRYRCSLFDLPNENMIMSLEEWENQISHIKPNQNISYSLPLAALWFISRKWKCCEILQGQNICQCHWYVELLIYLGITFSQEELDRFWPISDQRWLDL